MIQVIIGDINNIEDPRARDHILQEEARRDPNPRLDDPYPRHGAVSPTALLAVSPAVPLAVYLQTQCIYS